MKGVIEKMAEYGDRVQFSLASPGPQPNYQVMNALDKKMAFDRNHHLLRPDDDAFTGANATPVFTLEQVQALMAGSAAAAPPRARSVRVARGATTRTAAARLDEQFATQRYEYFRNNRQRLPANISEHSDEITALMRKGIPVEQAFDDIVKKYY